MRNWIREIVNKYLAKYDHYEALEIVLAALASLWLAKFVWNGRKDFRRLVIGRVMKAARALPGVQAQVDKETQKIKRKMQDDFAKSLADLPSYQTLPEDGLAPETILSMMQTMRGREESTYVGGKASGGVYIGTREQEQLISRAYDLFLLSNTLHPDLFPSTRKMEAEVVAMALDMLHGVPKESCGNVTSGGTESILMAMKAYRDSRPDIERPEVVVPESAHAAFHKAGNYFGITIVSVPVGADFRANVSAMEAAITRNTVAIVGSAPSFPQGVVDPIQALAQVALRRHVGLHVDCCLGGFLLPWLQRSTKGFSVPPFDFSVDGVTSISADTHKYGLAPKGTSLVLFRTPELRRHMYFVQTEWSGGVYASPTIGGSKPGALIAGAWAMMLFTGRSGYISAAERIMETCRAICKGVREIPGIRLLVEQPVFPLVCFTSDDFDVYKIADAMNGWSLNILQRPRSIHLCLTLRHVEAGVADTFVQDLRNAAAAIQKNPSSFAEKAPIYGLAADMPDRAIISDVVTSYLDSVTYAGAPSSK